MNREQLLVAIERAGIGMERLARQMNISRTTLYRKLNRRTEFTLEEISQLVEILSLNQDQMYAIFFDSEVSNKTLRGANTHSA